jgi:hypothetical protein
VIHSILRDCAANAKGQLQRLIVIAALDRSEDLRAKLAAKATQRF